DNLKKIAPEDPAQTDEERCQALLRALTRKDLSESDRQKLTGVEIALVMRDAIEKMQEPTLEEFDSLLEQFRTFPFLLREAMGTMDQKIKSVKRSLPRKSGGGRRSSLSLDQRKDACLRVGHLMGKGVAFPDALARVGRHYEVGPKTIQRAWQQRAEL